MEITKGYLTLASFIAEFWDSFISGLNWDIHVCMNTQISFIGRVRDNKFGLKIAVYHM